DVAGHGFSRLGRVLMRIALCEAPAADEKLEPVRTPGLTSELATAKQVALAQDPAQRVVGVEHEQCAHARTQHRLDRLDDARALGHADHAISHYVANLHVSLSSRGLIPTYAMRRERGRGWAIGKP